MFQRWLSILDEIHRNGRSRPPNSLRVAQVWTRAGADLQLTFLHPAANVLGEYDGLRLPHASL